VIYPINFEEKLGFDKIRNILQQKCLGELGREKVNEIKFSDNFENLDILLKQVAEFKQICIYENTFPLNHYFDVRPFLRKILVEGAFLSETEFFDLRRSLDSIRGILHFFKTKEETEYPTLKLLTHDIKYFPFVAEKIDTVIDKTGSVKDNASPELLQIRRSKASKETAISRVSHQVLNKAIKEGFVEQGVTITIRDGKMLIPVPVSMKRKIQGVVHDESSSGKTAFIEPFEVMEAYNELRELEFSEKREIIKILVVLTENIRPYVEELLVSYDFMAKIDFTRAKALFAIDVNANLPQLVDKVRLDLRAAVHPLLYLHLKKEGKRVMPLDIYLTQKNRIILISGPNAGGKSVCLKTVGLLQYMLQCGLLIPVNETSQCGLFEQIFIDIGDEQSIDNDLSTYSSHLLNMRHFSRYCNDTTLILIDEFGTGTEPLLGGAIAEAILDDLNFKKTYGVITTHYTNLKHFASNSKGVINAAMLYDEKEMKPLFQLEVGKPGSSFAFEIAQNIGFPPKILDNAKNLVGSKHIDYDKNLRQIENDKKNMRAQILKLQEKEQELDILMEKYQTSLNKTMNDKKIILEEAKNEASKILMETNKKIENTIRIIKESNADKETTKQVRKELIIFKEEQVEHLGNQLEDMEKEIERIKKRQERKIERKKKLPTEVNKQKTETIVEELPIKVGDLVKLDNQNSLAKVLEIKGDFCTLAMGAMQTSVAIKRLKHANKNEAKNYYQAAAPSIRIVSEDISERKNSFVFGLDVRGKRAEEAIQRVTQYIDEALVVGAHEVKILHGTGNGILRNLIRDYLSTIDLVETFSDEKIEFGGTGITIVRFNYD